MEEFDEIIINCPYCGGIGKVVGRQKFQVICQKCGARTKKYDFKTEAILNWNKREYITGEQYVEEINPE